MPSNLNYKQAANVTRRTWDRETYEARAKARTENLKTSGQDAATEAKAGEKRPLNDEEESLKEEFTPATEGAAGPYKSKRAFLKARRDKVDIDSKAGTTEIVSAEAVATVSATTEDEISPKDGVTKMGVGWHCKVCDCFLKDSLTYLDHINGRKHQRNLGYSMRVEQSTKDQVVAKLAELAQENEKEPQEEVEDNFEDLVKAKDEQAQKRKEERARKREERKKRLEEEQEQEEEEAALDPDMAAMMGFSGFGGGNKNR